LSDESDPVTNPFLYLPLEVARELDAELLISGDTIAELANGSTDWCGARSTTRSATTWRT